MARRVGTREVFCATSAYLADDNYGWHEPGAVLGETEHGPHHAVPLLMSLAFARAWAWEQEDARWADDSRMALVKKDGTVWLEIVPAGSLTLP